ncbi:GNAT family N-acetyltransferase [Thalassotalea sp. LPB0316]|uniref:GNAT family N-acetyltransferase n=1 Tax=Thalassotalea sp. LPB0316 TaxID=2769490 RepID=UPI001865BC9C|nr:GNAT family N-acetyltransferase [Thalassotalea sp. LPB0316]QOL24551.1 GNAT family N-acetyltransferase [Thalassotalea sp. LPB0316]
MSITLTFADYHNPSHAEDILSLLNAYALDPMGGGEALSQTTKDNLIGALQQQPQVFSIICYFDGQPAGLVNCVKGFSTFAAKPLVNIHDVVVLEGFRGKGISQLMLDEVERMAREQGCCKLTLEVLEGNKVAQNAYRKLGFAGYELDPEMGQAVFWQKSLK